MLNKDKTIPEDILQQMRLKGRITGSEQIGNKEKPFFQTYVTVPAIDHYNHPITFGVNASAPLGPDGQDIDVVCNVRPYNRRGKDGRLFCNNSLWLDVEDKEKSDVPY